MKDNIKNKDKRKLNHILSSVMKSYIYYPLVIVSIFSILIIVMLFYNNLNSQILIQSKNLETLSKIYESSIIVSFNNDSENLYKQTKFQIENSSNISVITFYNENDYFNKLKSNCLNISEFYLIIKDKKLCYLKKVTYSKNQFFYLIKSDFKIEYAFILKLLALYIVFIIFSYLLSLFFIKRNKSIKSLNHDSMLFDECLKYIENNEYCLLNDKINKMNIFELQKAVIEICNSNKLKNKAMIDSENKAIIIHDTTKIMNCIPREISKESINVFISIISNIKNILKLNFDLDNQFDIKKCIIEGAEILAVQGIIIDLSKVKSYIFFGKEGLLTEVFSNIFSNIIEHSLLEIRSVIVNTYLEKKEGKLHYFCSIRNYGSFVLSNEIELIFQKNYTSLLKNKKYGTGLYFCKNVIDVFGGSIYCNSEKKSTSKDSFFEITIALPAIYEEIQPDYKDEVNKTILLSDFIITILEDDNRVTEKWKEILGEENVFYYDNPQDFLMDFRENPLIARTNLIISDFYFHNVPLNKLLDFELLKNVLDFKGKIFLHTNAIGAIPNKENFDYLISSKNDILNKRQLISIFNNIHELN
ncbi:MAG: ATP-binding protein [Silvanigrellaceae bacterium]|nr:ATP-binding protein [Silvanigrellaceae bacterium]